MMLYQKFQSLPFWIFKLIKSICGVAKTSGWPPDTNLCQVAPPAPPDSRHLPVFLALTYTDFSCLSYLWNAKLLNIGWDLLRCRKVTNWHIQLLKYQSSSLLASREKFHLFLSSAFLTKHSNENDWMNSCLQAEGAALWPTLPQEVRPRMCNLLLSKGSSLLRLHLRLDLQNMLSSR